MAAALEEFHYHATDDADADRRTGARTPASFGPEAAAREAAGPDVAGDLDLTALGPAFSSNEAAARFYLDALLSRDERPAMRSVVAPERPERVPGLVVKKDEDLTALGTQQVRFTQTHRTVPIFGAGAVVELTGERDLVSVSAQLDEVTGVEPVESLSRTDALERVARFTGASIPAEAALGGKLMYYKDEQSGAWHLVWFFKAVPAEPPAPPDAPAGPERGHGLGPRPIRASVNYLVDAHDGEILFFYSNVALAAPLPQPTRCTGVDEDDVKQTFFGRLESDGTACQLDDPLRSVRTYDIQFADIFEDPPVPERAVVATGSDYGTTNRAAVSAHLNACRVQDFYKSVLQRNGIDGQGMVLVSMVNTTASGFGTPPVLKNAFWSQGRMWYGQIRGADGRLVSLSRFLDVIGHELTHGVVETTSALVYATQSGALNESFADVAGVIINNWYTAPDRHDVGTWSWEIGAGLGPNGEPLRDFADPKRLGDPAHMDEFRALRPGEAPHPRLNDSGWVHVNSNIHNKAVHNLLTLTEKGQRVFTVEDVAVLTYLGMARLVPLATFSQALQAIVDVALTYFGGSPDRDAKVAAIRGAYAAVGIS
ncbi:M4 family metallopeptidase [Nucisporomicrobium flavum]|uniref:M4 family metallopeptidase n=1 Tax=Nucisporomicrobium flavum TaxID=2785915 RepID=UPI003C2C89F6